jgi:hypothetical protein
MRKERESDLCGTRWGCPANAGHLVVAIADSRYAIRSRGAAEPVEVVIRRDREREERHVHGHRRGKRFLTNPFN